MYTWIAPAVVPTLSYFPGRSSRLIHHVDADQHCRKDSVHSFSVLPREPLHDVGLEDVHDPHAEVPHKPPPRPEAIRKCRNPSRGGRHLLPFFADMMVYSALHAIRLSISRCL